jgi:hypothetical protein
MAATGRTKRPQAAGCRHPPAKHLAGGGPSRGARLVNRRCGHTHLAQPDSVLAGYARDDLEARRPTKPNSAGQHRRRRCTTSALENG